MTLEKIVILSASEGPAVAPALAVALVVAWASWYARASALGHSRLSKNAGFSPWGMPSVTPPHPLGQRKSAASPAGPQA
jgi:hypothetical protein